MAEVADFKEVRLALQIDSCPGQHLHNLVTPFN
jgi:hypothetical protein